jgi:predicted DNA-binding transcriptional regulator AlpA
MTNTTMLKVSDVSNMLGVSPKTVRNWIADGTIPPPVKINSRILRWDEDVIKEWINSRKGVVDEDSTN